MALNFQITNKRKPEYGNMSIPSATRRKAAKARIVMTFLGIVYLLYMGVVIGYLYYLFP